MVLLLLLLLLSPAVVHFMPCHKALRSNENAILKKLTYIHSSRSLSPPSTSMCQRNSDRSFDDHSYDGEGVSLDGLDHGVLGGFKACARPYSNTRANRGARKKNILPPTIGFL